MIVISAAIMSTGSMASCGAHRVRAQGVFQITHLGVAEATGTISAGAVILSISSGTSASIHIVVRTHSGIVKAAILRIGTICTTSLGAHGRRVVLALVMLNILA